MVQANRQTLRAASRSLGRTFLAPRGFGGNLESWPVKHVTAQEMHTLEESDTSENSAVEFRQGCDVPRTNKAVTTEPHHQPHAYFNYTVGARYNPHVVKHEEKKGREKIFASLRMCEH